MSADAKLLRIDIEQAARKLSRHRFKNAADCVAELIRLAASGTPTFIAVSIESGRFDIVAQGFACDRNIFESAAALFDPTADPAARVAALSRLDTELGISFLAAFAEPYHRVLVEMTAAGRQPVSICFAPGKPPLRQQIHPQVDGFLRITVEGALGKPSLVSDVAERCRFSPISITLNGASVNRGYRLPSCLVHKTIRSGNLNGAIGIPAEGDFSILHRLRSGIVVDETFLSEKRGLILEAAIECPSLDEESRLLYERLRPHGRDLYLEAAALFSDMTGRTARRFKERLMSRYEHSFETALVTGLRMFATVDGRSVDIVEIKRQANLENLFALDRDRNKEVYVTSGRFVLLLTPRERKFLDTILDFRLPTPPRRVSSRTFGRLIRRIVSALEDRGLGLGRATDARALSDNEKAFLSIVAARAAVPVKITFFEGKRWAPKRRDKDTIVVKIPRYHPGVRRMISLVTADPRSAEWALVYIGGAELAWMPPSE